MELFSAEAKKLTTQLEGWQTQPKWELEATFGLSGHVDQMRFLAVAQRLKAKGYKEEPPKDTLTITIKDAKSDINVRRDTLKNNTRFTLEGTANIEEYCRTNSLAGLDYKVMLKTAIGNPSEDDLVLEDYDMKFKLRRENDLEKDSAIVDEIKRTWPEHRKAFRLIRRWTFTGDGCVFDLSMVRSNKKNASGAYILTKTFSEQDILNEKPSYEIEVELKHGDKTDTVENSRKLLVKAVGEVLRGLQKNSVLIRKSQKRQALDAYFTLVGSDQFRGVKPRTLEMKNFVEKRIPGVPNIRDSYNVTDKADGLRVLGFCDSKGELFLIDKALNVYRTGLQNPSCANSLVDGEWITSVKGEGGLQKATQQLWLFDIYIAPNKQVVDALPFYSPMKEVKTRYKALLDWHTEWNRDGPKVLVPGLTAGNRLVVLLKRFEFGGEKQKDIFDKAHLILGRKTEYNTDGLIFTSNAAPLPGPDSNFREQFKWKPAEDNTIDFLVRIEKDPVTGDDLIQTGIHPTTGAAVIYKTLILKVGSTTDPACSNPRDTILNEREIPKGGCRSDRFSRDKSGKYRAVPFNPSEYSEPLASICRVRLEVDEDTQLQYIKTERSQEPIQDKSIVEMRYDMSQPEGWRWIPIRVRVDKTEKLERGELTGTLNADFTAESVWKSIHNPITKGMISTGNEAPLKSELESVEEEVVDYSKPYFERTANKKQLQSVEGLRNFHKHYIKGDMLLKPVLKQGQKVLLDLAVGEAADINRWTANNVSFVYGMDVAAKGILDSHRGAYAKYLNKLSENAGLPESQRTEIAPMIFGIGDVSRSLATGDAGSNDEETNMLRSIFGKVAPTGPVPPFVEHKGKGQLQNGADVISCMFALHYFFKDKETFKGFLNNVDQHLAVNGYFVACFFDGQKVFDLLKDKDEGESVAGMERNNVLWRITKQYTSSTLPSDETGFGLAIKNNFISIGAEHVEYLVPFELLEEKMKEIGCFLVPTTEWKALGIPASTETFDASYKRVEAKAKKEKKEVFPMIKPLQEYSFLNRWCIFKRVSQTAVNEEEVAEVAANEVAVSEVAVAKEKKPVSLAWQDVSNSGTTVVQEVQDRRERIASLKPTTTVSEMAVTRVTGQKPMKEGLGTAIAAATVARLPAERDYEPEEIFRFGAMEGDVKGMEKLPADSARYLSPSTPFRIIDNENPDDPVVYPSILHYLAAMEYKKATSKPDLGRQLFSLEGSVHQKALREQLMVTKTAAQKKKKELENLEMELKDIASEAPALSFQKYNLTYNEAKWLAVKQDYLELACKARYEKDAKFREILEELRQLQKTLVYDTKPMKMSDLGADVKVVRKNKKKMVRVEGENKMGKLFMQLASFPGYKKIEAGVVGEEEE